MDGESTNLWREESSAALEAEAVASRMAAAEAEETREASMRNRWVERRSERMKGEQGRGVGEG